MFLNNISSYISRHFRYIFPFTNILLHFQAFHVLCRHGISGTAPGRYMPSNGRRGYLCRLMATHIYLYTTICWVFEFSILLESLIVLNYISQPHIIKWNDIFIEYSLYCRNTLLSRWHIYFHIMFVYHSLRGQVAALGRWRIHDF